MVESDSVVAPPKLPQPLSDRRWPVRLTVGLSLVIFALGAVARLSGWEVWDDGLMFARYAENLLRDGAVAWNPGGAPTWGLTSLGHLAWVLFVRAAATPLGLDLLAWAVLSSWLAGLAFLVLAGVASWRWASRRRDADSSAAAVSPRWCLAWTLACLALGFRSLGGHFGTGMDTMTTLCWLLGFMTLTDAALADRRRRRWTFGLASSVAVLAGTTFFVRPDAALFPAAVLASLVLWGERRPAAGLLLAAGAWGGLLWVAARAYFGTAMPLPFYVKSAGGGHYGDAFAAQYAGVASAELLLFAGAFWLPLLAIVADVATAPRAWWRGSSPVDRGLAAASLVFAAYHLTQVAPIMGGSQRFYQPLVPAMLWLSWGSMGRLVHRFGRRRRSVFAGRLATAAVLVLLLVSAAVEAGRCVETVRQDGWPGLDLDGVWSRRASHYWPALDVVSGLPPGTVIAATEVGLPGAMNLDKTVVDLAGLHDPRFARADVRAEFSELVFRAPDGTARRPDVLYLPHPHYESMNEALDRAPEMEDYRIFRRDRLGSVLGVAVLRGSPAEAPVVAALERRQGWQRQEANRAIGARSRP